MAYPGRQNIYEATIRRMVQQALEQQEQEFREQHENDTDRELLMYLSECAIHLRHTPWPGEIVGGKLILERIGSWERAVMLAKLPTPGGQNQTKNFARVREETERQKELYRKRKAEKKVLANQKRLQQEAKRKR